jgi:hypothetical protein
MPISPRISTKYLFFAFFTLIVSVSSPGLTQHPSWLGPESGSPTASTCPAEKDSYDIEQDFGANGQDNKDDYYALLLAATCLSGTDGKTLVFPEGIFRIRQYRITESTSDGRPANNVQLITYQDAARLRILGQGSGKTQIVIKGDFHLSADEFSGFDGAFEIYKSNARSVTAFALVGCEECLLSGFEITGENEKMTLDPGVFASGFSHCVMLSGVSDTTISDLFVHHCLADGLYITASGGQASERVTIMNSRFVDSGRNNVSVIQARKITFVNNRFNRGLYFPPWGAVDVEPNIHNLNKVDQLTGNILFYNNQVSSRGIELNITRDVSGNVYLRRFAFYFASGFPPVFQNEVSLTALTSVAECKVIPYGVYEKNFEDYFKEVFFGGRNFDIDDDGRTDTNPCYGASFRPIKNAVEFSLPSGSALPREAELSLNGVPFTNAVTIHAGKLIVDTRTLPNGHWKLAFFVKDARGETIPTALVPVIIANERPDFGLPAAQPTLGSKWHLQTSVLTGRGGGQRFAK